ncbi:MULTISPECIES: hypothetical protein [unclassified Rhizobium]|uniref:hypothetical protein n=1 Tax=unclassified Rhizobium TaxID=2613769 RepID=UPI001179995B|nr:MULTISPECIES: hypothetical protein [unclassified Rhizobium]
MSNAALLDLLELNDSVRRLLDYEKPVFEYTNYLLRMVSTWIAVVVAYRGLEIEFIARERIVFCLAYVGVGSLALLASFLTYRMMMLNRFIADEIAFRYAGRGRIGLLIAFALSHLLLIPFIAMSVLIGASVWHLLK